MLKKLLNFFQRWRQPAAELEPPPAPPVLSRQARAEAGDPVALYELGEHHLQAGEFDRARELWERAAAAGSGEALFNLGLLYENGEGVPKDDDRAQDYYRRGAALGHAGARARVKEPWRWGAVDMDLARARSQPRP